MEEGSQNLFVTAAAVEEIKKQLVKRGTPEGTFRVGIKSGGCDGFTYQLMFEDKPARSQDLTFNFDGLNVIVDKKSIVYINGSTLDYESSLMRKGFKFLNPNEKSSCGCGNSFSVQENK